jgi:L-asparagine transporter-like permease
MKEPSRPLNRMKIFIGVAFICAAVIIMLAQQESSSLYAKAVWAILLGIGVIFYLWGRFFSREEE